MHVESQQLIAKVGLFPIQPRQLDPKITFE